MTTAVPLPLQTELLGVTDRLWCRDCKMHWAVRVTFTVAGGVGFTDYCRECHGGNVNP